MGAAFLCFDSFVLSSEVDGRSGLSDTQTSDFATLQMYGAFSEIKY